MNHQIQSHQARPTAAGMAPASGRFDQATTQAGSPPRLRGGDPADLVCWATACRASAAVLDREGHPGPAAHLRSLAHASERRAARLVLAEANLRAGSSRAA